MPLPLTVSCFSKIQIGFTFLVPAHLGSPGKRAVKRVCVCVLHYTIVLKLEFILAQFSSSAANNLLEATGYQSKRLQLSLQESRLTISSRLSNKLTSLAISFNFTLLKTMRLQLQQSQTVTIRTELDSKATNAFY